MNVNFKINNQNLLFNLNSKDLIYYFSIILFFKLFFGIFSTKCWVIRYFVLLYSPKTSILLLPTTIGNTYMEV